MIVSRDERNRSSRRNREDRIDYDYFIYTKNDKSVNDFNEKKKKALLKLIYEIMENNLTERQREIVTLVKIQGMSQKEVAKKLNVSPSVVCKSLKMSKKHFDTAYTYFDIIVKSILSD